MNEAKLILFPNSLEYRFCNPGWRRARTPAAVEELLETARGVDAERCQRLVLSGGSPLEHPQFIALAGAGRDLGFKRLALETDARPLARPGLVESLGRLGIEQLVVVVAGVREQVHEAVMHEKGAFRATMEGLRRALNGPLRTYVVAPALHHNMEEMEELLQWCIDHGKPQGFLLSLPEIDHVPAADRGQLLPYSVAARLSQRVFRRAQGNNVEYGFSTRRGVIPCGADGVLDKFSAVFHDRFNYFKHSHDEKLQRVGACEGCSLTHSCAGVEQQYVATFGDEEFKPIPLDVSMGWKLRKLNRLEDFEYHNVSPFKNDSELVNPRGLLRINGHCNMSCSFCFVDRTAPDFETEVLKGEILQMQKGGTRHLVLSGGEPTLHPDLPELVSYASSLGFDVIEMQSNGVRCGDMAFTRDLVERGLTKVTVSLHSVNPERSDVITRLPNAFAKTVQAMHNFRSLGVLTQIAHVITKANYQELPDTVRYLRKEFPEEGGHLSICFAIAQGISDLVFHWVIPRFAEIKPFFSDALDYCLETGVGFGGMIGQGGFPPCMLDGKIEYYEAVLDKIFKSEDSSDQFHKSDKCKECSFDPYCLGPRRSYVEHYGDGEIHPFQVELPPPRDHGPAPAVDAYAAEAAQNAVAGGAAAPPADSADRPADRAPGLPVMK